MLPAIPINQNASLGMRHGEDMEEAAPDTQFISKVEDKM
jgi:hypothetical protein